MPDKDQYRIVPEAENRGVNAVRERGRPFPRCKLRPQTEQARWLAENWPFHVAESWCWFGYCTHDDCGSCPRNREAMMPGVDVEQVTNCCPRCETLARELEQTQALLKELYDSIPQKMIWRRLWPMTALKVEAVVEVDDG